MPVFLSTSAPLDFSSKILLQWEVVWYFVSVCLNFTPVDVTKQHSSQKIIPFPGFIFLIYTWTRRAGMLKPRGFIPSLAIHSPEISCIVTLSSASGNKYFSSIPEYWCGILKELWYRNILLYVIIWKEALCWISKSYDFKVTK